MKKEERRKLNIEITQLTISIGFIYTLSYVVSKECHLG
jgi:hypothetical protein